MPALIQKRAANTPAFRSENRAPISGGNEAVDTGGLWVDRRTGVTYRNGGTRAVSYWYPLHSADMWGYHEDFGNARDDEAVTETGVAYTMNSGVRVIGDGIAETDSGGVVTEAVEGGSTLRLTASATAGKLAALATPVVFQPDTNKHLIFEARVAQVSAITLRNFGFGAIGTAADGLVEPVTGDTVTATLVQDDLALMHFDVRYTDVDRFYIAHNKSDAAADMAAVDTGVNVATAGTFQLLRCEIGDDGTVRFFINKARVGTVSAALDANEELAFALFLASTSSAVKSCDVRGFHVWAAVRG